MAKAKKQEDGRVCIDLSEVEAEILYAVSRNIGGHPGTSGRWAVDNILHVLDKERVTHIEGVIKKGMTMQTLTEDNPYRGDNNDEGTKGTRMDRDDSFYDY